MPCYAATLLLVMSGLVSITASKVPFAWTEFNSGIAKNHYALVIPSEGIDGEQDTKIEIVQILVNLGGELKMI